MGEIFCNQHFKSKSHFFLLSFVKNVDSVRYFFLQSLQSLEQSVYSGMIWLHTQIAFQKEGNFNVAKIGLEWILLIEHFWVAKNKRSRHKLVKWHLLQLNKSVIYWLAIYCVN